MRRSWPFLTNLPVGILLSELAYVPLSSRGRGRGDVECFGGSVAGTKHWGRVLHNRTLLVDATPDRAGGHLPSKFVSLAVRPPSRSGNKIPNIWIVASRPLG